MRKTSDIIWQDAQHQVLFETLDLLKSPGAEPKVLLMLRDYTEYHFSLEERYMAAAEYPDIVNHTRAHNGFRKEIEQLLEEQREPDAVFREIIVTYLSEWLTRHVFGSDKELETFILRSDVK